MLPLTREEFLIVFANYNAAIWPAQAIAYALGAIALWALVHRAEVYQRLTLIILGAMWL